MPGYQHTRTRVRLRGDARGLHAALQMPNNERMRALQSEVGPLVEAVICQQGETDVGSSKPLDFSALPMVVSW